MSERKTTKRNNRVWTAQDRAHALAVLDQNSGVIKRTARQLGMPESTLRVWRDEQQSNPNPYVLEVIKESGEKFKQRSIEIIELSQEIQVRGMRDRLRSRDPISLREIKEAATIGAIAVDKLVLHQGKEPAKVDHNISISADESAKVFAEAISLALESANERTKDVIELQAEYEILDAEEVSDEKYQLQQGE